MDWAGRWAKMTEEQKLVERQRISLQGKLRQWASIIREVAPGDYTVNLGNDVEIPNLTKIRACEIILEHKYNIKVKILRMSPFKFEVLEGSEPILAQERGRVTLNLTLTEAETILTELERNAQYDDTGMFSTVAQKLTAAIAFTKAATG